MARMIQERERLYTALVEISETLWAHEVPGRKVREIIDHKYEYTGEEVDPADYLKVMDAAIAALRTEAIRTGIPEDVRRILKRTARSIESSGVTSHSDTFISDLMVGIFEWDPTREKFAFVATTPSYAAAEWDAEGGDRELLPVRVHPSTEVEEAARQIWVNWQ